MKNIAIFGGTFDPPTRAHEGIIRASLAYPDMDEVWLMPSGNRPDKPAMSSEVARLTMLKLVRHEIFADDERLKVTDFEQRLTQPTQTHQTIQALQAAYPRNNFWFVYGADAYHDMPKWQQGAELRQNIGMLLVERSGFELPVETNRLRHLVVTEATAGLSSTEFRRAREAGEDVDGLVCDAIAGYIHAQSMYAAEGVAIL